MSEPLSLFDQALKAEGVSGPMADLARSIHAQESGGGKNPATSNRGARGGMQILPDTFSSVADKGWSIDDPMHNARAGIRYLKQMGEQAGGDPALAAAGYYGGPRGLEKARKGVAVRDPVNPSYPNTLQYAQQVVNRMPGDRGGAPDAVVTPGDQVTPRKSASGAVAAVPAAPAAGAPVGVVLPESALAMGNVPATAAAAPKGPDAWQAFLAAMPASQKMLPLDLNYLARGQTLGEPVAPMSIRPPVFDRRALGSNMPNFAAFQAWKGRSQ